MFNHLLFYVTLFGIVTVLTYSAWQGKESLRITYEYCDARDEFNTWRKSNPYIYIGLSDTAKYLLKRYIIAYDNYLAMHPNIDGRELRKALMSLFDDLPPRPHKPTPKRLPPGSLFLFKYFLTINYICEKERSTLQCFVDLVITTIARSRLMNISLINVTGPLLALVAFGLAIKPALKKAKATSDFTLAQEQLNAWKRQNPNMEFKDSQEGTDILQDFVDASSHFVDTVQPYDPEPFLKTRDEYKALLQ